MKEHHRILERQQVTKEVPNTNSITIIDTATSTVLNDVVNHHHHHVLLRHNGSKNNTVE